jgi:hypothetical protein
MKDPDYLGLDTDNILQDFSLGWNYIKKGGWVFILLFSAISLFVIKNILQVTGIKFYDSLLTGIKILLS